MCAPQCGEHCETAPGFGKIAASRHVASGLLMANAFMEPPWTAGLDAESEIRAVPQTAQVRGLMIAPMLATARKRGASPAAQRERYLSFTLYPLREHVRLLVDSCQVAFPELPLRQGLRKLGRGASDAFGASTLGKVTLGAAQGVHDIVSAFAKGYELNLQPGRACVVESSPRRVVVSLDDIHYFLDSHHVGAFEGVLKRAGVRGRVLIARRSRAAADLLLEW
jgi:uncharacterized protein (TIGR02265 family)